MTDETIQIVSDRHILSWERLALLLLVLHLVLLFLPPLPPHGKGSLWSYLLGYGAVVIGLVIIRHRAARLVAFWASLSTTQRYVYGLLTSLGSFALALLMRTLTPVRFARFAAEEGLWEPVSLLCYLGSALILSMCVRHTTGSTRKHWQLMTGAYLLLGLEEIDYFSLFGGLIGRIQGIYAGSLHDLIPLLSGNALSYGAMVFIAVCVLAVAAGLWWQGYLQPHRLGNMLVSRAIGWAWGGLGFLVAGALEEARLVHWVAAPPRLEEILEMAGALCLVVYALELALTLQQAETV